MELEYQNQELDFQNKNLELKNYVKKHEAITHQNQRLSMIVQEKERLIAGLEGSYKNLKENFDYLKKKNIEMSQKYQLEMERNSDLETKLID